MVEGMGGQFAHMIHVSIQNSILYITKNDDVEVGVF